MSQMLWAIGGGWRMMVSGWVCLPCCMSVPRPFFLDPPALNFMYSQVGSRANEAPVNDSMWMDFEGI